MLAAMLAHTPITDLMNMSIGRFYNTLGAIMRVLEKRRG